MIYISIQFPRNDIYSPEVWILHSEISKFLSSWTIIHAPRNMGLFMQESNFALKQKKNEVVKIEKNIFFNKYINKHKYMWIKSSRCDEAD